MKQGFKKRKPIKKQSEQSYPMAFKDAKRTFQLLRRLQESDLNGIVICVHGKRCHYTKCDGGHYLPAHNLNTCFNSLNVWPQEKVKNLNMNDPIVAMEYRNFLIKKIGIKDVENLESTYKIQKKYSVFELVEMTKVWKSEIEQIKKDKNI